MALDKKTKAALELARRELIEERPRESLRIAKEALALIRLRVQNTGKKASGADFGNYSTNPLPLYWLLDASPTVGAKDRLAKLDKQRRKQGGGVSYKDYRTANNLQSGYVDLTATGEMWRSMTAQLQTNTEDTTTVSIEPTTARARRLVGYNRTRYGEVLAVSDKERQMLIQAHRARILKTLKKIFP